MSGNMRLAGAVDGAQGRSLRTELCTTVGFSCRIFGRDPNGRGDGDAMTAVRMVDCWMSTKPSAVAQRGEGDQSADALEGWAASWSRREEVVDVVDDEDEATDEAR